MPETRRSPVLVGRASQLADLRELILDQSIRLLTVTGGAGAGKSRLAATALRIAESRLISVDLAETTDGEQAWQTILDALGGPAEPHISLRGPDAVTARIGAEPMILLADNCDLVARDLASGLPAVLARCPELTVVATSRHALDLYQEVLYLVPPLSIASDGSEASPAAQLLSNCVETRFRDGAIAADRSQLEQIAAELDGVPVGLELAATAVGRLGAERTLERIRSGQQLPPSPFVDIPARHRSIRACVEWGLNDLDEMGLFVLLHVAASSVLTDLEEVLLLSGERGDPIAGKLAELVDRSLLGHSVAENGHYTYAISGFTRSFCRQLLYADRALAERVRFRRAEGLRLLAREITRLLAEPDGRAEALRLVGRWLPDIVATVRYLIDHDAYRDAIELLSELEDVWIERGLLADAEAIVATLLAAVDSGAHPPTLMAAGRELLGRWALRSGRFQDAKRLLAPVVSARNTDTRRTDPALVHRAGRALAQVHHETGRPQRARALLARFPSAAAPPAEQPVAALVEAVIGLGDGPLDDETSSALRDHAAALPRRRDRLTVLNTLGRTLLRARAPHRALEVFHLVLRTPEPVMSPLEMVAALEGCARAYDAAGDGYSEQTHRLSAAAHWIRATCSPSRLAGHSADPAVSTIGAVLDIDEAIAYALSIPLLSRADLGSPLLSRLTKRQLETALLVAEGMTNRMIANRLGIAEWTVVNHLRQVMTKLDCPSRLHVALVIERETQQPA
ncbi:LuxR C-terminal-related transcriptional regulator [Nocardia sp. NPDC004151]|uniref:helix-turn-helix transcriptional regulator n=1 Tax=Nocardia sp. NPDC004151 TaxID=3364304 RepID=UPI0036B3CA48